SSFGLGIFRLREVIKNAGILAYVCIFLRTISGKYQAKTDFSLRSTAHRKIFLAFGNKVCYHKENIRGAFVQG
ncbi:MAG: hypothetical protein IJB80_05645, partial [Clostridia bacterium]|nr:hypothetical protein [Clostridia bacterium]